MDEKYKILLIVFIILIGIALASSEGLWSFLAGVGTSSAVIGIMKMVDD